MWLFATCGSSDSKNFPLLFLDDSIISDCIYHFCEGHDATQHAAFGEAAHIAVTLRMHEEASYEGLDPIECEVRRRTFWLLFGGTRLSSSFDTFD
jgi:hypothetical protein